MSAEIARREAVFSKEMITREKEIRRLVKEYREREYSQIPGIGAFLGGFVITFIIGSIFSAISAGLMVVSFLVGVLAMLWSGTRRERLREKVRKIEALMCIQEQEVVTRFGGESCTMDLRNGCYEVFQKDGKIGLPLDDRKKAVDDLLAAGRQVAREESLAMKWLMPIWIMPILVVATVIVNSGIQMGIAIWMFIMVALVVYFSGKHANAAQDLHEKALSRFTEELKLERVPGGLEVLRWELVMDLGYGLKQSIGSSSRYFDWWVSGGEPVGLVAWTGYKIRFH